MIAGPRFLARALSVKWLFLFAVSPLFSYFYLSTIKDPVVGTHRDFGVFYTASTLLMRGDVATLFDPDGFKAALIEVMGPGFPYLPFPYPPHSVLFIAFVAALPFLLSLYLWLLAGFLGVMAAMWRPLMRHWATALAFLLCPASVVNMAVGQNGFISAALLCGGLMLAPQRPVLAGLLFGLLSYKPQLGVLIPLLLIAGGHWRAFWTASATVATLILLSLGSLGSEAWLLYLTKSGPQQLQVAQYWVGRFQEMSPTFFMLGRLLKLALWQAWALQALAAILAAWAAVWTYRRQQVPHEIKVAVALMAIFIVSPYALTYDMTLVSLAILLALTAFKPKWWEFLAFGLAWLTPSIAHLTKEPVGPFLITLAFLVLLRRVDMMRKSVEPTPHRDAGIAA
jgi:hypothetical protein